MNKPVEVLALAFSPRKGGNSDILLDEFLRGAREAGAEVKLYAARDLNVRACLECGECDAAGECVIRDDMDELYPLLINTKRIVVASPIFFYGLPSGSKAIVDRTQALWNRVRLNPELRRKDGRGFFIGVGATRGKNLFEGTSLTIKYFLDAIGLPMEFESLTYRRVEAKAVVKDHPTALREVFAAGKNFAHGMP
ncbi:MAG: flavodoxin family protein [Deltaproteobacteria bacterium]|nr:flavodoxin family protein [Deltaproteobacteria bacterium]MBW2051328.1 flavodoxin family protein [Deltaproteobacteria bacterium]MBW2141293.1 flavodoxin family protein [Deltaproteobacteria bacterium]MBW2322802.1 flavodoxin family protein [Deltaproteobacteria bacterium]